jgi:N-acetylglucosaminyl-diphospho-decaprenol L-rhamnosyltransferase
MEDVTGGDCTVRAVIIGVVVTHSTTPERLHRCLDALLAAGGLDRVILVDNSDDPVVGPVADPVVGGPSVEVLRTVNEGYGAAANRGVALARDGGATAVALLNDDVIVRDGWLDPLAEQLHGDVGAVQPKLLFADVDPPTINTLGVRVGRDGAGVDIGRGEPDRPERAGGVADIDVFCGGAVLFDMAFLDATGGFDERYFLYYEDVDLAARGRRLGWRYRCVPSSVVDHIGSATTSGLPERTWYLQERNRLWCAFRNADAATVGRALWLSVRRLRHEPRRVNARALAAGCAGAPRRLWERARAASVSDRRA